MLPVMEEAERFDLRGFIENSLLEWDNHVSAVAVAGGCNLRCPYCHSWRYVTGLNDLKPLDAGVIIDLLKRQAGWIDGVVFTGGEPTMQPGLRDLMAEVKAMGVETKLHTNGTRPKVIGTLLREELVDCLSLDYKAPLDSRFFAAAGIPENADLLAKVKDSFALAADSGIDREYHTTLDPQVATPEILAEMAAALEPGGTWFLQQFENGDCLDAGRKGAKRYSDGELDQLEAIAREGHGRVVMKRGKSA